MKTNVLSFFTTIIILALSTQAFSDIDSAKIALTTSTTQTEINFTVKIDNTSAVELRDLKVDLKFENHLHLQDSFSNLKPGLNFEKQYQMQRPDLVPGNYHFPLWLTYKLPDGIERNVLTLNSLNTSTTPPSGLTLSAPEISIYNDKKISIPLFILNHDDREKVANIQLLTPKPFNEPSVKSITIDPFSRQSVKFHVDPVSAQQAIQSELIFVISFIDHNMHYSEILKSRFTLLPVPSTIERLFSHQKTIAALVFGLLIIIFLLAKKPKNLN